MLDRIDEAPSLVIVNADVWRMESPDEDRTRSTAIAVRDGRILAVGADPDVLALRESRTRVVDAGGRSVIPGLVDAHTHFQVGAIQRHLYEDFSVSNPASVQEVLHALHKRIQSTAPGEWVRGDGLRHLNLAEQRYPTRDELDALSATHPVVIVSQGHHAVAANSRALALAGIGESTPEPDGGHFERYEDGRLSGILVERGKLRLDPFAPDTVLPVCTRAERESALQAAFAHAHQFGITGVHDVVADPLEVAAYIDLRNRRALHLRVSLLIRGVGTETKISFEALTGAGLLHGFGDSWLNYGGLKMSIDGSHHQRAAAVYRPYFNEPANVGTIRIDQSKLDDAIARCHALGVRAVVHAIGPRAVDMACDAFERAYETHGRGAVRHRIEHAFLPPPTGQLERIATLGLTVSTQAALIMDTPSLLSVFGPDSLAGFLPLRSMRKAGIELVAGTDFPGVSIDPFVGIGFAVNRRGFDGTVIDESEAVSLWNALAMYTRAPQLLSLLGDQLGTITPGKLADIVILDRSLGETAAQDLGQVEAVMTVIEGRIVFERTLTETI